MKTLFTSFLCSVALAQAVPPADVRIAISPWLSPAQLQRAQADQARLILKDAPAGSRLRVFDGWHLVTIVDLAVSGEYRERRHQGDLGRLLGWYRSAARLDGELKNTGAIKTPEVFDALGRSATNGTIIVVEGSPLYLNPAEPQFSFVTRRADGAPEYRLPDDSHLRLSRQQSPFGTEGRTRNLNGASVYFLYPEEAVFPNSAMKESIRRFWSSMVQLQQGEVLSFSADRAQVLASLWWAPTPAAFRHTRDQTQAGTGMAAPSAPGLTNMAVRLNPIRPEERRIVQAFTANAGSSEFSIGIMWDTPGVDADLYVLILPTSTPLYFNNKISTAGRYVRDYTDANSGQWEQVILDRAPAPTMEAYVNLYRTSTALPGPFTGKFMVRQNGQTRVASFQIAARTGNIGHDFAQRASSQHWTRLNWQTLTVASNVP